VRGDFNDFAAGIDEEIHQIQGGKQTVDRKVAAGEHRL
jgi:hypothetical protein